MAPWVTEEAAESGVEMERKGAMPVAGDDVVSDDALYEGVSSREEEEEEEERSGKSCATHPDRGTGCTFPSWRRRARRRQDSRCTRSK